MKKYLTVVSSFVIMLCLGGVYAWSIVASELMGNFDFSAAQSQLVFGVLIAVFPTTMIFAGKLKRKLNARTLAILSALFFSSGYLLSGFSNGNFYTIVLGIGVLAGIGTGLGYLVALTTPVKWFPEKKGLITGIAAAGFGLAAFVLSLVIEKLMAFDKSILQVFTIIGVVYGLIILVFANFLKAPVEVETVNEEKINFIRTSKFQKLFSGIFFGTFAGLLVIGSLKSIGAEHHIGNHTLIIGISVFAIANFLGRLIWGALSDYTGASISIFLALTLQAVSIFLIGLLDLTPALYILLSFIIGFSFGGNFVLFAKETAQIYGIRNLGIIYPYVFIGYAVAGIFGPLTGGWLFDIFKNFNSAIYVAAIMSLIGAIIFLINHINLKKLSLET